MEHSVEALKKERANVGELQARLHSMDKERSNEGVRVETLQMELGKSELALEDDTDLTPI